MLKIKFLYAGQHEVSSSPILPGSLIVTDERRLYCDDPLGVRNEITDIIELPNEVAREQLTNPYNKFYYVISTHRIYRYDREHGWVCINGDPEFIGADGKIIIDYLPGGDRIPGDPGHPGAPGIPGLPGDVAILDHGGVIPEGYLPIATMTKLGIATLGSEGGAARYGNADDVGLGKVTNDAQVKATDVEDVGPDDRSGKLNVTSSARLYEILGASLSELPTVSKTLIGSISEIFTSGGQAAIPAGVDGHLVTYSGEQGKFGEPRDPSTFVLSPEPQTANNKLLVASAIKGGMPTLKSISDFATTEDIIDLRKIVNEINLNIVKDYIPIIQKGNFNGVATLDALGKLTFAQLPTDIPARYVIFNNGQTFQYMLDTGALNGPPGKQGIQGIPGIQGMQGTAGPAGKNGEKGDIGMPGPIGPAGIDGPRGPQGNPTTVNGVTGASITITANMIDTGTLPVAQLPIVPIGKGGTGATTAQAALTAIGAIGNVFHASTSAPSDTRLLWIDTGNASIMKYWSTNTWVPVRTAWA